MQVKLSILTLVGKCTAALPKAFASVISEDFSTLKPYLKPMVRNPSIRVLYLVLWFIIAPHLTEHIHLYSTHIAYP